MNIILETNRLILRSFDETDCFTFSAYRSDPDVARYQGWETPYTLQQAETFVAGMKKARPGTPGEWYQLAIQPKQMMDLVGDCAFCVLAEDERQAVIGFTLSKAYQGIGYGTEAVTRLLDYLFFDLNMHRVRAVCDVENIPSARLLERVGMRREAYFIENAWSKGYWSSEFVYAVLHREWLSKDGSKKEKNVTQQTAALHPKRT